MSGVVLLPCVLCDRLDYGRLWDVPYCRGCYFSGAAYADVHAEWFSALHEAHIHATFSHTGGGCWVLEIPVSEDRCRFIWLGWGPRNEDMLVQDRRPAPGDWMAGCVYEILENDDWKYAVLEDQLIDHSPDTIVRACRAMAIEAMGCDADAMQLC